MVENAMTGTWARAAMRRGMAALGVAVTLAACSADGPARDAAPSRTAAGSSATTAAPPTGPSIVASGYAAVCNGTGFPDASAYRGPGPHPVAVSVEATDNPSTLLDRDLGRDVAELPAAWESESNTGLQLVACVRVVRVRALRTCPYRKLSAGPGADQFSATLFERTLAIEVRLARTGRPVGRRLQVSTDDNTCASTAPAPTDGSDTAPHQYGTLTDSQLRAVLADRVQATAP